MCGLGRWTWQPVSAAWGPGVGYQLDSQLLSHPCGHPISWRRCPCSEDWKLVVLLPRPCDLSCRELLTALDLCSQSPAPASPHHQMGMSTPTAWHSANRQLEGLHVNHSTTQGQVPQPRPPQAGTRLEAPSTPAQRWDTCVKGTCMPGSHPHSPASITPLLLPARAQLRTRCS